MRLVYRRILFWSIVVCFVVGAPILIIFTAGWRFNNGSPAITGSLVITTEPSGAVVTLNSESETRHTPATVSGLHPGTYSVSLRRDGYLPWDGTVTIRPGEATALRNIRLIQDTEPQLLRDNVTSLLSSDNALFFTSTSASGIQLYSLEYNGILNRLNAPTLVAEHVDPQLTLIDSSRDGGLLVLASQLQTVFLARGTLSVLPPSLHAITDRIRVISATDVILLTQQGALRYSLATQQTTAIDIADDVIDVDVVANTYSSLSKNGDIFKLTVGTTAPIDVTGVPQDIVFTSEDVVAVRGSEGVTFYSVGETINEIEQFANTTHVVEGDNAFFIWGDTELWYYSQESGERTLITRSNDKLVGASHALDYPYVVYAQRNELIIHPAFFEKKSPYVRVLPGTVGTLESVPGHEGAILLIENSLYVIEL